MIKYFTKKQFALEENVSGFASFYHNYDTDGAVYLDSPDGCSGLLLPVNEFLDWLDGKTPLHVEDEVTWLMTPIGRSLYAASDKDASGVILAIHDKQAWVQRDGDGAHLTLPLDELRPKDC